MTNDDIITAILEHEGGFVNNPNDRGHATNWGIAHGWMNRAASFLDA